MIFLQGFIKFDQGISEKRGGQNWCGRRKNNNNKGRSPSNGKLSDFPFYIDSQKSAHRKFKK